MSDNIRVIVQRQTALCRPRITSPEGRPSIHTFVSLIGVRTLNAETLCWDLCVRSCSFSGRWHSWLAFITTATKVNQKRLRCYHRMLFDGWGRVQGSRQILLHQTGMHCFVKDLSVMTDPAVHHPWTCQSGFRLPLMGVLKPRAGNWCR